MVEWSSTRAAEEGSKNVKMLNVTDYLSAMPNTMAFDVLGTDVGGGAGGVSGPGGAVAVVAVAAGAAGVVVALSERLVSRCIIARRMATSSTAESPTAPPAFFRPLLSTPPLVSTESRHKP